MPSVFIVGGNAQYRAMFKLRGWVVVDVPQEADLMQFCGGADVNPSLYGHGVHPTTTFSTTSDGIDEAHYELATRLNMKKVGICRGGQFLNVMNGGKMVQDCDGHATYYGHEAIDMLTGRTIHVSSTHHQMMMPADHGEVLAVARESLHRKLVVPEQGTVNNMIGELGDDVEAVFYPQTESLCFQPHPEFRGVEACTDYYFELIERCLGLS